MPESVGDVILATMEDDGVRVWMDGKLVIDAWGPHDSALTEASVALTAGKPHRRRSKCPARNRFSTTQSCQRFRLLQVFAENHAGAGLSSVAALVS